MIRTQVRVIIRTKPTDSMSSGFHIMPNNIVSIARKVGTKGVNSMKCASEAAPREETVSFSASAVLHDASQETVYNTAVSDLVDAALQGYNCALLCYGQCGAGKTYTMFGTDTLSTRGCVPRAIGVLFDAIGKSTDRRYNVKVTFVEVYGEQVFDLLGRGKSCAETAAAVKRIGRERSGNNSARQNYAGLENHHLAVTHHAGDGKASVTIDGDGSVVLRGVDERHCVSEADAMAAVYEGLSRRLCGGSLFNPESSRSHAVLTIHITSTSLLDSDAVTHSSRMKFVDFAGNDRVHKSSNDAEKQEAQTINRSLVMLEQVILAVSSMRPRHVPFRQSKLTMLLKESLGGGAMTTIIANVWPQQEYMESTLATLNFARRMMRVESVPTPNVSMDPESQIRILQKQVNNLKSELRMQEQFAGRVAIPTAPLETDEINEARETVMAYVEGTVPQLRVSSVREMHACFSVFRTLLLEMETQARTAERSATPSNTGGQRVQQRLKNIVKQGATQELKEAQQQVNSVADNNLGVGMGVTDRPSTALGDMLQQQQCQQQLQQQHQQQLQQQRSGIYSTTAAPAPASGRCAEREGVPSTARGRLVTPNAGGSTLLSESAVCQGAVSRQRFNESFVSTLPPQRDALKEPSRGHPTHSSLVENRLDGSTVGVTCASFTLPQVVCKPSGRTESVIRDKRAAFEVYKRTQPGMSYIQTMNSTQEKLFHKNEEVSALQRKLQQVQLIVDFCNRNAKHKSSFSFNGDNSSNVVGFCGSVPDLLTDVATTCQSGRVCHEGPNLETDNPQCLTEGLDPSEVGRFFSMKLRERNLCLRHATTAVTRAKTEQSTLVVQLNQLREDFMNSFECWHQMNLQPPTLSQQTDGVQIPVLRMESVASLRRAASSRVGTGLRAEGREPVDRLGTRHPLQLESGTMASQEVRRRSHGGLSVGA
uniref:Putative kinesin n=1 Tax=Trypanosoma congolense (strain IL3000) TaxID=1068625 RepID=G0UQP3_TRYCI|nr:putative kinesin [Trypanosoma congolense IL3000]